MTSMFKAAMEGKTVIQPVIMPEAKDVIKESKEKTKGRKTLKVSGPLSEVYTQALNVMFAKKQHEGEEATKFKMKSADKEDETVEEIVAETVSQESQANDAIMAGSLFTYLMSNNNVRNVNSQEPVAHVYLTSQAGFNNKEYAKAAQLRKAINDNEKVILAIVDSNTGQSVVSDTSAEMNVDYIAPKVDDDIPNTLQDNFDKAAVESLCKWDNIHPVYSLEELVDYCLKD